MRYKLFKEMRSHVSWYLQGLHILTKEESFPMGNRKSYYKVKGILAVAMI